MKQFAMVGVALVLLAGCSNKSTTEWVDQVKAQDSAERLHAIRALGERPTEAAVVVPALSAALKDRDPFVRRDAAHALAKLGPEARPALPALRPLLKDRNHGVRKAATEALKKIDPTPAARAAIG
jgi:HEAT repeat protein